jgi:hypothetical protein
LRVELPSGNWVDVRDKLMAADKFAAQSAVTLTYEALGERQDGQGQVQRIPGGVENEMRNALLGQVIDAWSFEGVPVPSQNIAGPAATIGATLDLDDYNVLQEAVQPLLEKVRFGAGPNTRRQSAS